MQQAQTQRQPSRLFTMAIIGLAVFVVAAILLIGVAQGGQNVITLAVPAFMAGGL